MDNQTKRTHKSRKRKRSLRGSFGNASDDTMVKSTTEEGKSQSDRILTRHRRRVSGLGRDDMDFVGLQFPKGSQRRRFRKTKRVVNDNQSPTENQNNDAQTTTNLSETVHNDYVKHLNKDIKKRRNDIFLKKAPGKRRRKRRPLIASSTSDAKVDGATFSKPKETFIKDNETTETPTTPLISSLDCDALNRDEHAENDDTVRENHEKFQSHERLSDDWRSCKYKKSNEQTSSLCDDSEVEEIINEKGDKQNEDGKAMFSGRLEELSQNKNDCTDISAKSSPHTDDNSCSAITSHDGDSIYSSECGSLKDRLSHNATDSDGGSITTSDRNLSLKHKHELGHHKTAIDFRVGGRLEARDYLNMWYPSKIIQVDWEDKEVLIHFERWNSRFDEWVPMDSPRLRAIKRTSARKERKERAHLMSRDYKIGEVVHAKWTDCKMYPAKIIKMNSDATCNVMFYDGFERVVQSINIRKLPPELVGRSNFKIAPPPETVEKRRRSSGSKSEDGPVSNSQVKGESPESSNLTFKTKMKHFTPVKGNVVGLQTKKRKLLVGGIFQAKRHQLTVKPETTSKNESHDNFGQTQETSKVKVDDPLDGLNVNDPEELVSGDGSKSPDNQNGQQSLGEECGDGTSEDGLKRKRYSGGGVARKEFIIEEDHNHYKCLVDGCGKAFRKDALLASHMKHYHRDLTKTDSLSKKIIEEGTPLVENKEFEIDKPQEPPIKDQVVIPVKKEGNTERKLITEKRRQLLLQRKLERRHQQAAMALKAKLAKKSVTSSLGKDEDNIEGLQRPEKLRPPTRKKKFVFTSRGVIKKLKKKKLEEVERLKNASSQDFTGIVIKSGTENDELLVKPDVMPEMADDNVNVRVIMKRKRKRRPEHAISSDDSDKSVSPLNSDSAESVDDKRTTTTKFGKRYNAVSRSGIKFKNSRFPRRDSDREEVVNCRCQRQEEDGLMMQCEVCLAWQHGTCFNIEDVNKVPEKYVCFACENPKGLRQSFKYKHNQDWYKTGDLATFKFLPKNDNWKSRENILRTHNLMTQILAINNVLHSLQYKLQIAREVKHPNLVLWSKPWTNTATDMEDVSEIKPDKDVVKESEVGHVGNWAFSDHSYSVPTRIYHDSHFVEHTADAFLADHCDDKNLCLEVAANEVLDVQGTGPPPQDCILDYCLETKTEVGDDNSEIKDSIESLPDDQDSKPPCKDQNSRNKDEVIGVLTSNEKTRQVLENDVPSHTLTDSISEEIDFAACKVNLLDHIEQLQEELDHRLDELDQQLESLESQFEFPSLTSTLDSSCSVPRFKRLLKAMIRDLMKVRRMSLYSCC